MFRELSNSGLVEKIETTRQNRVLVGLEYGLAHPYTVKLSAKLDELLNDLYKHNNNGL